MHYDYKDAVSLRDDPRTGKTPTLNTNDLALNIFRTGYPNPG